MKWLDQFRLTQTEKRGFLVILVLIHLVLIYFLWLRFWPRSSTVYDSNLEEEIAIWELEQRERMRVLNQFDPNTVDSATINTFYIPSYAKLNWLKFRRYNQFEQAEDVLSIYGMDTAWYNLNKDSIVIRVESVPKNKQVASTQEFFFFDPNTISEEGLLKLGFPDWLATRLLNYCNAGGQFRNAEDLLKLYNFPNELYQELKPYVQIEEHEQLEESREVFSIELNQADSTSLVSIPGIGPVFASRIVQYRTSLGGLVNKAQLLEIYNFDQTNLDEVDKFITVDASLVKQLRINQEEFKVLLAHPYLNFDQVKAIVNYRETIGPHKNINDLLQLDGFEINDVKRLEPYLSVE